MQRPRTTQFSFEEALTQRIRFELMSKIDHVIEEIVGDLPDVGLVKQCVFRDLNALKLSVDSKFPAPRMVEHYDEDEDDWDEEEEK